MSIAPFKILIVDDHQPMREMIRSVIDDLPADIFEAANGEESLAQFRSHHPDLVLMDLFMPGMSGIQATQKIILEFPDARVVIVTQQNQNVLREAARAAGAHGYVLKEDLSEIRAFIETTNQPINV